MRYYDDGEDEDEGDEYYDDGDEEDEGDENYDDGDEEDEGDEGRRPRRKRRRRPGKRYKKTSDRPAVLNAVATAESQFTLAEGSRPNQMRGVAPKVPAQPVGLMPASTAYEATVTVSTSGIYLRYLLMSALPPGVLVTKLIINDIELTKGDGIDATALSAFLQANQQLVAAAGRKFNGTYTVTIEWSNYNTVAQWVPPLMLAEQNTVCKADATTSPIRGFLNQRRLMGMLHAVKAPAAALRV